jgi:hypothetical protein
MNKLHENEINKIKYGGDIISDPSKICNIFNDYFIDLTSKQNSTPDKTSYNSSLNSYNSHTMFLHPVDVKETYNIIMSLKNSKSSGYDDITTKILKHCAPYITLPLAHIINLSFSDGLFPQKLKFCIVKPLFKKGDKLDTENYRPITLVPILSKILEKAMYRRINNFLTKHDTLCSEQYGFRSGRSTSLACFDLVRSVTEGINNGTPVVSIFLDMSKAFDFVNHCKLLHKLEVYGIRGRVLEWIESYLIDRMQCVEIKSISAAESKNSILKQTIRSDFRASNCGVPQGSILGPLLFLLYVNDLPRATTQRSIMFADDTTLIVKCERKENFELNANKALIDIIKWMKLNNLNINTNKTKFIQYKSYNSKSIPIKIEFDHKIIDEVNSMKFLGIMIDEHLNWKDQIEQICNKLNRFVFALKRLRETVSKEAALTAYHGYVSSVLAYGLILWGNSVEVDRVFKIQKKCIRAISNVKMDASCVPLFRKLNILPLPCLYIRDVCVFVNCHQGLFIKRSVVIQRQTRPHIMSLLYKPPCRKDMYKRNIVNMSIVLYNKLPNELRALSGQIFKRKMTKWLFEKCFYSVKDYLNYKNV